MCVICCVVAAHASCLISQTGRIAKAWEVWAARHFAYQPSSCWQTLGLIKPPSEDGGGWQGSPPGRDRSWDNLAGNEKVELSVGNIKIIIIICQTMIYIFTTAEIVYLLQLRLTQFHKGLDILFVGLRFSTQFQRFWAIAEPQIDYVLSSLIRKRDR